VPRPEVPLLLLPVVTTRCVLIVASCAVAGRIVLT